MRGKLEFRLFAGELGMAESTQKVSYRIFGQYGQKGKHYLGFMCTKCEAPIYALDDKFPDKPIPNMAGEGIISVPCFSCKTDAIYFKASEFKKLQAAADGPPNPARPRVKPSNRPRQPMLSRYRDAHLTSGTRFIEDRPDCAVIIARCIATWSYIESALALLLASLLKINTAPAVAMFLAIQNSRTQADVLQAVAQTVLEQNDLQLFSALMNIKSSLEKERNDLVHGQFGGSVEVERGLLWVAPRHAATHSTKGLAGSPDLQESLDAVRTNTFVYEPEDLETIAQSMEWLHEHIGFVRGYLASPAGTWRSERYRELCGETRFARELSRMRDGQKKARPAQKKQSPRERRREERRSRGKS